MKNLLVVVIFVVITLEGVKNEPLWNKLSRFNKSSAGDYCKKGVYLFGQALTGAAIGYSSGRVAVALQSNYPVAALGVLGLGFNSLLIVPDGIDLLPKFDDPSIELKGKLAYLCGVCSGMFLTFKNDD